MNNNIEKNKTSQAEISNYDKFVTLVFKTIKKYGRCSYSQSNLAAALKLSRRTIIRYTHKLKEDPRFKISEKFWSTNWITFASLSASLLWVPVTLVSFSYELININSYSYIRKRVLSDDELKKEHLKWERVKMNANKLFKNDDDTSDNAYYPTSWKDKKINSTSNSSNNTQLENKNPQMGTSKNTSTDKLYAKLLINNAKKYADLIQKNRMTQSIASRHMTNLKKDCPAIAIDSFKSWMRTEEGNVIMQAIFGINARL